MVIGITFDPPGKDPKEANGQNRQTKNDINTPTIQSSQPQQQLMSSPKSTHPSTSNQAPNSSLETSVVAPQQQGSGPDVNYQASQPSKVSGTSSDRSQPGTQQKSSSDVLSMLSIFL